MDIPEELIKPAVSAGGVALLSVLAWIFRRFIVYPSKWVRGIAELPGVVTGISKGVDKIHSDNEKQRICIDIMLANGVYGIFVCDCRGYNSEVNATYCSIVGAVPDQLMGRGWENFIDHDSRVDYEDRWKRAMDHSTDYTTKTVMRHADGNLVPVIVRTRKVYVSDNLVGYMGFIRADQ